MYTLPSIPNINILCNHGMFLKRKKLTLVPYYYLNQTLFSVSWFSTSVHFWFQDPTWDPTLHVVSMSMQSPPVDDSFSSQNFVFYDLDTFEGQVGHFVVCPSIQICPIFSHNQTKIMDFWGEYHTIFFKKELYYLLTLSAHLCILCRSPRITLPKAPGSLYQRAVFRNQVLGTGCAHCQWGVTASSPSQQTELGNFMYVV